jgi:Na+/proline symporter
MLAARNERDAMSATLWFNIAHYALRPWPWLIVALCSIIVYPSLDTIVARFPGLDPSIVRNDLAYPAMLVFLPHGLLGLAVASLAAAYMSTISTHLNWGASYMVDDVYRRFIAPKKTEQHYVAIGRLSTVALIVLAMIVSLWLENALQAFQILLQIGAGTGLIFLLRWFWWRINAWSEIAAMVISFLIAVYFQFVHESLGFAPIQPSLALIIGVGITTLVWITVTLMTPPTPTSTLQAFYDKIRPLGPGWRNAVHTQPSDGTESLPAAFLCWFLGCVVVYAALFGTGFFVYGQVFGGVLCLFLVAASAIGLFKTVPRVGFFG